MQGRMNITRHNYCATQDGSENTDSENASKRHQKHEAYDDSEFFANSGKKSTKQKIFHIIYKVQRHRPRLETFQQTA